MIRLPKVVRSALQGKALGLDLQVALGALQGSTPTQQSLELVQVVLQGNSQVLVPLSALCVHWVRTTPLQDKVSVPSALSVIIRIQQRLYHAGDVLRGHTMAMKVQLNATYATMALSPARLHPSVQSALQVGTCIPVVRSVNTAATAMCPPSALKPALHARPATELPKMPPNAYLVLQENTHPRRLPHSA